MSQPFDADAIAKLGWRQGAVLGPGLARVASDCAPSTVQIAQTDWVIVMSHDCDVVNDKLAKEPVVELLRATPIASQAPDKQVVWGRNPRSLQLAIDHGERPIVLACKVHERWLLPREALVQEAPRLVLPDKPRRLIAEWLAKRYVRAAFPTAFDERWRRKMKDWSVLLEKWSRWVQGVYLRLSTLEELPTEKPYRCHVIVAAPAKVRPERGWRDARAAISAEVETFWKQFAPGIVVDEVEVLGTDELTLADIEHHQRFDADWVSFADDTDATPAVVDLSM